MQKLPAHAAYKESGLPWVGIIPAHWDTRRNRFLFREVDHRSVHGDETHLSMSQVHGLVPSKSLSRKSLQSENYAGGKLVETHDLVLNRLKAHLGVFARAKQSGIVSPDYTVLRPKPGTSVQYCELLFKTPGYVAEFRRRTKGIVEGFWRLYTDDFYSVSALLPPADEQETIVAYLRTQDAHIARFIKAKRDLIALLTEQKLRIIDQAVTRGIDASVTLKPSGIEWLGEIPEHWELRRLKFLASNVTSQISTKANDEVYLALEHIESWTGVARPLEGEVEFASTVKRFVIDDVLFGKLRPYLAKVTCASRAGVCVSELLVLRSRKELVLPTFLEQMLRCKRVIDLINSSTAGAKMPRADWAFIGNMRLPVPPIDEQEQILSFVAYETKDLDEAITRAKHEIDLIREYRDRLIADVVTGQVDVRDWRPSPDDDVNDEELAALGDDQDEMAGEENSDDEEE
ncbi:MAG: restriction endonuclease subunit S [Nitrosomonas sp.]|nr:restriction endonuclease subunit S [Nitrosomonas sp.]OQW84779.1 MAG: restriction endonuclease subunit S [Proteobacteria bacterium ST_bin16]TXI37887.1 MAG: restriction endonuclease subunit S [Nitrosomonas sp.]